MEHRLDAYLRSLDQHEADNEDYCIFTATSHGYTQEQALECEAGSVGCPDCPFVRDESS